ncbi:diguanylate cyclase [Eubacteriaceae bacterium ES3]|nr:diguanylate cyclase [Eubacteriaceae bacterium ES3]
MNKIKKIIIVLVLLMPLLSGCVKQVTQSKADDGHVDLSGLDLENEIITLSGEWEFYWNQLLLPESINEGELNGYIKLPSSWTQFEIDGQTIPGQGYGTYRLTFNSSQNGIYGIKLPKIKTAYELYINNKLVASAGVVGTSKDAMTAQYLSQIAYFNAREGENELVMLVSNYYMASGGLVGDIELGSAANIQLMRERSLNYSLFLFGALSIIGIYHLAMFLFRKKDHASLFFGLFCILVALRTMMIGDSYYYTLFQNADFTLMRKIQSILFYLMPPMLVLFFKAILPDFFHKKIADLSLFVSLFYVFAVILMPASVFSVFSMIYLPWCLFLILYMVVQFVRIILRHEKESLVIVLGGIPLLIAVLMDIIPQTGIVNDQWPLYLQMLFKNNNYLSTGQLIFVMVYSLHLAKKYADSLAFTTATNLELDDIVALKTDALTVSNQQIEQQKTALEKANAELKKISYHDPLTGLWNRRKYDEVLAIEWKRCLRYKHSIAVIFIDIDYFKNFNDTYGHLAGDKCLIIIADILNSSLSRATDMAVRYGGEEFVILQPETDQSEAMKTAHMLLEKIENQGIPHCDSQVKDCVTVSVGVSAMVPSIKTTPEILVMEADEALYRAKNNGRNQVQVY